MGTIIRKKLKKPFGQRVAQNVPATLALILVWFLTGLWHGASVAYIVWGVTNGIIIIFSMWMEPVYEKGKSALHINENAWLWRAFQAARTFLLVTFIKVIPEVGSLSDGFGLIKRSLTNFSIPSSFRDVFVNVDRDMRLEFFAVIFCIALLIISSIISRKKITQRHFNNIPIIIRIVILIIMLIMIFAIGLPKVREGVFMYAKF